MDDIAIPNTEYARELQLQRINDALFYLNHPEERPAPKVSKQTKIRSEPSRVCQSSTLCSRSPRRSDLFQ